jgi:hypothetical protein
MNHLVRPKTNHLVRPKTAVLSFLAVEWRRPFSADQLGLKFDVPIALGEQREILRRERADLMNAVRPDDRMTNPSEA